MADWVNRIQLLISFDTMIDFSMYYQASLSDIEEEF